MDSLQGIPVEYKSDAFNMPRTGTTLCHPKIGYVDLSVIPLSTRMEITPTLPQIPDTKLMVTSKVQFLQLQHVFRQKCKKHNPSHVRRHTLPPQPSQHLITSFRPNANKLKLHKSCSTKSKPKYSMLQIKTYFTKTHFDSRHLSSSSFSFYS